MNTTSNFTTVNGWCLPGSGTWVAQDTEDFYVDCNGDLWMPCFCDGEEDDEGLGRAGEAEAQSAAEEQEVEPPEAPEQPMQPAECAEGPGVICVNQPACILYYPGRSLLAGGVRYAMGMLADSDKGSCWTYRGVHSGGLRLRISHANMTSRVAVREGDRVVLTREGIYPGLELCYAVILENHLNIPATVTAKGQEPFEVAPGVREWLYLGPRGFLRDEGGQARIAPGRRIEAVLDMELSEELTVRCCAYHEKNKIAFCGHEWSPPPGGALADLDRALFLPPVQ